jgi:uncharacterized protein Yka (UPF0111/DUF47 family)
MTRNDLCELESEVYKNLERIKREQAEFVKGVEHGMDLMYKAVNRFLFEEEQKNALMGKAVATDE